MYNLLSVQFICFFLIFWVAVFVSLYLPGRFILDKLLRKTIPFPSEFLFCFVVGLALWGVQGYVFGYLHLRFVSYLYLVFFLYYFIFRCRFDLKEFTSSIVNIIKQNKGLVLFIVVGSVLQIFQVFGSGLLYTDGVRFFGNNAYDGVMHLAYIQEMVRHFPPIEPGSAGTPLVNYHYWSDLIIANISRVWFIPVNLLFFQFFPILISVLTGLAAYFVVRVWGWSRTAGLWSLFFLYFAGDATYLVLLIAHHTLNFMTPAIDNGVSVFLNMPNAMAKLVFLTSLITFEKWIRTKKYSWNIITVLLFSVLVGLKIYYAIFVAFGYLLVVIGMIISSFQSALKKKNFLQSILLSIQKNTQFIISGIILLIAFAVIYLPVNSGAGGLIFDPLEWPKIFLGSEVLNWRDWTLRQQVYTQAHNYKDIVIFDVIAILITLLCIHGTRLIGLIPGKKIYQKLGWEKIVFFIPGIVLFHFFGFFTFQQSGGLNIFNFFVVATVVMSLLTAIVLDISLSSKNIFSKMMIVLIIVLTVPRVIFQTYDTFHKYFFDAQADSHLISNDELQAFSFIKSHTAMNDIIQSSTFNLYDRKTPYVAYFADRETYSSGENLLDTHNQPVSYRENQMASLFQETNIQDFIARARKNHINIIYVLKTKDQQLNFNPDSNILKKIYENNSVLVYQVIY